MSDGKQDRNNQISNLLDRYQHCIETNNANEANGIVEEILKLFTREVCAEANDLVDYASEGAATNIISRSLPALIVAAFMFNKMDNLDAVTKCIRMMFETLYDEVVDKVGSKQLWREHLVFHA